MLFRMYDAFELGFSLSHGNADATCLCARIRSGRQIHQ